MELTELPVSSMAAALMVTFVVLALSLISSVLWQRRSHQQRKPLNLPPGPRGWPLIGSLGLLAGALPPHRALAALAARHGALMHLRLGSFHAVVASSAETARLVLRTHDLAFADRPPTAFGALLAYGYKGILQTPYGPYWRMARKLCATELFTSHRVDSFEPAREQEMRLFVRELFESAVGAGGAAAVKVKERVQGFTMRNILRMAVGDKWSGCYGSAEGVAFQRAMDEAFAAAGAVSNVGEWLPWLDWLDVQGLNRRIKRVHEVFDRFLEQILDEHEKDSRKNDFVARDLVDVLLQVSKGDAQEEPEARLTRDGVKAIIQDIFAGGTETGAVTVEWAMAELLRRPDALAAATAELDRAVGHGARPAGAPLRLRRREGDDAAAPRRPSPVPAARPGGHGGRQIRRPRRRARAGERVGRGAGPGVVARHARRVPAGAVPRRGRRRGRGRARGALRAAAVRGRTANVPGVQPRVEGDRGGAGEPAAWVRVAAEDVNMDEVFGLSLCLKVPLVAVAEPRLPAHLYNIVDE